LNAKARKKKSCSVPRFANTTQPRLVRAIRKYKLSAFTPLSFAHVLLSITSLCMLMFMLSGCNQSHTGEQDRQSKTIQQRSTTQLTYVAIGASETFGIGADAPYTQNWASDLAMKLGPQVHFIDLGIPGILIHQAIRVEVPVALDAHPNLVTIWLAVNDILQKVPVSSYAQYLDLLLSRLQASAPSARIAVANVPDLTLLPYFYTFDQQLLQTQVQAYNTAIATVVRNHHTILVDLYQRWQELSQHPEYISDDGLHPSAIGYARLAELFYEALQTAQGSMRTVI
jgi:acyl-CoA thioesterase I